MARHARSPGDIVSVAGLIVPAALVLALLSGLILLLMGVLGLLVPEADGGMGLDETYLVPILEANPDVTVQVQQRPAGHAGVQRPQHLHHVGVERPRRGVAVQHERHRGAPVLRHVEGVAGAVAPNVAKPLPISVFPKKPCAFLLKKLPCLRCL